MLKFLRVSSLLALASCTFAMAAHVAVLETVSSDDVLTPSECQFLTDELRSQAGTALPDGSGFVVMTRENINAKLPSGKTPAACEGSCLVETGRNISADYVVRARVSKFGDNLALVAELYETSGGKLLGSITAMRTSPKELWEDIRKGAKGLFAKVNAKAGAPNQGGSVNESAAADEGVFAASADDAWSQSPFETPKPKAEAKPASAPASTKFLTDPRDGKTYKIAIIGKKAWMAENLNYASKGSECYNDDYEMCTQYGRLYSWSSAMKLDGCDSKECGVVPGKFRQGVCPDGWHLPTRQDWDKLVKYVRQKSHGNAAKVFKSTFGWHNDENGNNASHFNVLPAGFRFQSGNFMRQGQVAKFWSSEQVNAMEAKSRVLLYDDSSFASEDEYKQNELSVRCVSDK